MKKSFVQLILEEYGTPENALTALAADAMKNPVDARLNMQVLLNTLGREEESFAISNELVRIAPQDPRVLFNHGWHWLKRGQLQKGLALLEFGRGLNTYGHPRLNSSRDLWMPHTGKNQTVIMNLEGGFGDEIIHVRFARNFVEKFNCKVIVVTQPSLAPIFNRMPWVSAVAQREAAMGIYHDSWVPGMSAAFALGLEFKDISSEPYLTASDEYRKVWKQKITAYSGRKLKVGIRWAGNPEFEHQQYRLFPSDILTGLRKYSDVQFFSFQRDNNLIDLPEEIIDLSPDLKTWDDTAAALMEMDLVISSCTSVAHMSAALGIPTWVIVPALPYFIWAHHPENDPSSSPWYKSVRLFRQGVFGRWDDIRESINQALQTWLKIAKVGAGI
ncbi:MAG: hypothetical protein ACKOX6_17375 [Bdellovibrio sp.]